jgi:1-phosphofructokinase family hexose kinase
MRPPILTITLNPAIDLHLRIADTRPREVVRALGATRSAGGKGVNVARVLATLGVRATAAVALGGADGAVWRSLLEDELDGIGERARFEAAVLAGGSFTRTNVTIASGADAAARRRFKINQAGPAWSGEEWAAAKKKIAGLARGRKWVVLAGTPPPGVPPDAYRQIIETAHAAGARCAIDASGEALRRALAARPDLVRINREELAETLRIPMAELRSPRRRIVAARRLIRRGVGMVALTDGPREALLARGDGVDRAKPPSVIVRGAMGAGDAMLAGLIAGFEQGRTTGEALRLAVACGAATAAETETAFPSLRRIDAMLKRVDQGDMDR